MDNSTAKKRSEKIKLFIDADDTILLSSECVIDILNKKYNIYPPKTYQNLTDWSYRSIYGKITKEECESIYKSDEFFDSVKVDPKFMDFYLKYGGVFEIHVTTKGTPENIRKKKEFFEKNFPGIYYHGIVFTSEGTDKYSKASIDMSDAIQIDDRLDCLVSTNSSQKILLTRGKEFAWNLIHQSFEGYRCIDWQEIAQILVFALSHRDFFINNIW